MDFLSLTDLSDYYAIPDYQRDYAWGNAECSTLIDDVFEAMFQNGSNHFIGAIVTVPFDQDNAENMAVSLADYRGLNKKNVRHVVDGQQRLTSISVLVKAIKDLHKKDPDIPEDEKEAYDDQLKVFLFGPHRNSSHQPAPKLLLNGNTGRIYNYRILGVTNVDGDAHFSGAKRLSAAKKHFEMEIERKKKETLASKKYNTATEFYDALIDTLFNNIQFVEIACDSDTNAFQVFESLNGKGLDLTAADRIKNIWMAWAKDIPEKAQKWESFAQDIGENYVVNFFVVNFFYECMERIGKNRLPEQFKASYVSQARTNMDSFYNYLKKRGTIYGKLRSANTKSTSLDSALLDLRDLGSEQVYVMLYAAALHYQVDLSAPSSDYLSFVNAMTKLIVRMQVCDKNLNGLDSLFSDWIETMKSTENPLTLTGLVGKVNDEIRLHLKNEEFKSHFETFAPKDRAVSLFYLVKIEKYMRKVNKGDRNPMIDLNGLTVEHIVPQNIESLKNWYGSEAVPPEIQDDQKNLLIERIGNKALLYGDDNSAASNNYYLEKVDVYKNGKMGQKQGTPYGTFELIKEVVDSYPNKFNHEEVNTRASKLADIALKIW